MWMSAAMVALFLCVPPEVAGSFLDAHNCEFICCLSQALQPLPTCVPPEESRLQKTRHLGNDEVGNIHIGSCHLYIVIVPGAHCVDGTLERL